VKGVLHSELGIGQIIFYQAGELKISDNLIITLASPGAVMLKIVNDVVKEICVSDPTRKLSRMLLKISGNIVANDKDNLMSVYNRSTNMSDLTIDLPTGVYAGQSVIIGF
jgi:chondroitin AC lyase